MTLGSILHDMWDIFVTYYIGQGLLASGVGYTLALSAIAVVCGAILGSLLAIGKMSRFKALKIVITAFVEIMRGTPALLQLYIAYFIVPMIFTFAKMSPFACVAIGLSLAAANVLPEYAKEIRTIILCGTLVYELVGPAVAKICLKKAGEIKESRKHSFISGIRK